MPRLTLCADDFAFSPAISATIADLAAHERLNAISCMAVMPGWERDADLLQGLPANIEMGLHIVLTDEKPLTAMPQLARSGRLPSADMLTRDAWFGKVPLAEIAREVDAQFARFIDVFGRAPAFVDGHHHSHVLPGIRDSVIAATARRAPQAWLRNCGDRISSMIDRPFRAKAFGSALHCSGFARSAAARGLKVNGSFAGHYDFRGDYHALFPAFLRRPRDHHLVMCHPGSGIGEGDSIASARASEAEALRTIPVRALAADLGFDWGTAQ